MAPTLDTRATRNGTSEPPRVATTRVSTVNHRNGITSDIFVTHCPACSHPRRHTSDGLRQCACGLIYRLVVTATIGAEAA